MPLLEHYVVEAEIIVTVRKNGVTERTITVFTVLDQAKGDSDTEHGGGVRSLIEKASVGALARVDSLAKGVQENESLRLARGGSL